MQPIFEQQSTRKEIAHSISILMKGQHNRSQSCLASELLDSAVRVGEARTDAEREKREIVLERCKNKALDGHVQHVDGIIDMGFQLAATKSLGRSLD